jgi:hypothetical protein
MGVLDDAIREHLDLRRRHGVAEEELRRQEEEALGPARREVAPEQAGDDGAAAEAAAEEPVAEAPAEAAPGAEQVLEPTEEHDVEELELAEHDAEPELAESLPPSAAHSDVASETIDPVEEPGFDELDEEEELDDDEELEEGDLDDEELPADDADVLEDTPDFLQETPEHDRLWFEQKPPRDFDFD